MAVFIVKPSEMGENMTNEPAESGWKASQVYIMATVCLGLGVALGYLFRGSEVHPSPAPAPAIAAAATQNPGASPAMPSLEQMQQMAEKKAQPLLDKLKTDPNNADLLTQVAHIYEATHQFKAAADYYSKALDVDPKNLATRTALASNLYYNGDVDGALGQLQECLRRSPRDPNSLFNEGMIRLKGKNDPKGAVAAWQQLLKSNPDLDEGKKNQVEKLIASAKQSNNTTN